MRAFAAIDIPDAVKDRIIDASRYFSFRGVTLVKREALHITLGFFGEVGERMAAEIAKAMDGIHCSSFEARVHGISYFKPRRIRVIYAGISDGAGRITEVHDALLGKLGIGDPERFVPHATIGRIRGMQDRKAFLEIASEYEDYDFGSFEVGSIVLKTSTLTPNGSVYEELHKSEL
ncbi:MAG: RNA 2',3'-cyclic phosphodiesterase [Candidatus Marsarchaeota archaeon]|jgi:2'-5' RNA ligase|nr:RNA 2',3'-cyclic phosphodiesterase [Candidatus Marsarchaeota archaeon]